MDINIKDVHQEAITSSNNELCGCSLKLEDNISPKKKI